MTTQSQADYRAEVAERILTALEELAQRYDDCGPSELELRDWWGDARRILAETV